MTTLLLLEITFVNFKGYSSEGRIETCSMCHKFTRSHLKIRERVGTKFYCKHCMGMISLTIEVKQE